MISIDIKINETFLEKKIPVLGYLSPEYAQKTDKGNSIVILDNTIKNKE